MEFVYTELFVYVPVWYGYYAINHAISIHHMGKHLQTGSMHAVDVARACADFLALGAQKQQLL